MGDHIYTDAALAKINFRWRTALILRELEQEVEGAFGGFRGGVGGFGGGGGGG